MLHKFDNLFNNLLKYKILMRAARVIDNLLSVLEGCFYKELLLRVTYKLHQTVTALARMFITDKNNFVNCNEFDVLNCTVKSPITRS